MTAPANRRFHSTPLGQRVEVYGLALAAPYVAPGGLNRLDMAGYLYDRLPTESREIARRVLDAVGVSL